MKNVHLELCGTSANNSTFPLFCRPQSNFESCLLIDNDGETWADTCCKDSWSEAEVNGTRKRIKICQNFTDDDEIAEFIDSIKEDVDDLLQDWSDYGDIIRHRIQEKAYDFKGNNDKIVCSCFDDYVEACNLSRYDVLDELKESGSLSDYVDDLLNNPNNIYFLGSVDEDKLLDEVIKFIK